MTEINSNNDRPLRYIIPDVTARSNILFEIEKELKKESDRGCSLVSAAYIENEIVALLDRFLIVQNKKGNKELFDFNGPIGTFSSKIKIAHALGLISKEVQNSIDMIRKIRNEFAHLHRPLDFSDKTLQQKIDNLLPSHVMSSSDYRNKFIKKVQAIVAHIHLSLANTPKREELIHDELVIKDNQEDHELEIAARRMMKITSPDISYESAMDMAKHMKKIAEKYK